MDHTAEQDQEHQLYGGEVPDEGEFIDVEEQDGNNNSKDLVDMKKRLKKKLGRFLKCRRKSRRRWAQLKVATKQMNIPGMKQFRGRRPNPYL